MVGCDGFEDAAKKGSYFERPMVWNRQMMGSSDGGREPDVGTLLSHGLVTESPQCAKKFRRVDVAGDFHTASASSRTKWRRMILGIGPGAESPK